MQIEFKQISENIIFYNIFNAIAICQYTLQHNSKKEGCDSMPWYSTKIHHKDIKDCFPNIWQITMKQNADELFFLVAWIIACILNNLCGVLANYLVRIDKNLCL